MGKAYFMGGNTWMEVEIGETLETKEYGKGVLTDIETHNNVDGEFVRFGLTLENNPFSYPVAYFTPTELNVTIEEAHDEN